MNWLTAALAFSLIMLVLATVVTIVLETGYKILSTRERGFRLMMERIFDEVLSKRIAPALGSVSLDGIRTEFLSKITHNQAYENKTHWLRSMAQSADLKSMTMLQFAERLADTDAGRAIASSGTARVDTVINDLAQKFDRIGQGASQRFQSQAHFWCLLVSVVCAFAVNVDAVVVFKSLLHNDALAANVVARLHNLAGDETPRPKSNDEAIAALQASTDTAAQSTPQDDVKAGQARAQAELARLEDTGLPIASEYWPICIPKTPMKDNKQPHLSRDPRCLDTANEEKPQPLESDVGAILSRIASLDGARWILSVLLAGLLIGLGAPFWFDLARSLTRVTRSRGGSGESTTPTAAAAAGGNAPPQTPVDAFKVAIAAARPILGRALLSPEGRPQPGVPA